METMRNIKGEVWTAWKVTLSAMKSAIINVLKNAGQNIFMGTREMVKNRNKLPPPQKPTNMMQLSHLDAKSPWRGSIDQLPLSSRH